MGHPILSVGLNSPSISNDKKVPSERSSVQEEQDAKPFSSTLNEQLEKTSESHHKRMKSTESVDNARKDEKTEDELDTEKVAAESGNSLPVDANDGTDTELNVKVEGEEQVSEANSLEEDEIIATDDSDGKETEQTNDDMKASAEIAVVAPSPNVNKQTEKQTVKESDERPLKSTDVRKQQRITQAATTANQATVDEESASTDTKPVLRSDILHAILKKHGTADEKKEPSKVVSGATMNADLKKGDAIAVNKEQPITTEKQQIEATINKRQQMTDLLRAASNESSTLKPVQERGLGNFNPLSTATLSGTSTSTNIAPQTTSVGQSIFTMQPAIQSQAWGKVLSSRVVWMAREGVQQAELRLNPSNLGPVDVKLHMHNDQANVAFVAHHAATRDALEQALPRLRESFQENGMNLANADVSDQASGEQSEQHESNESSSSHQAVGLSKDELASDSEQHQNMSSSSETELGVSVFA
jgi:flagellar hook-length control protein FliK